MLLCFHDMPPVPKNVLSAKVSGEMRNKRGRHTEVIDEEELTPCLARCLGNFSEALIAGYPPGAFKGPTQILVFKAHVPVDRRDHLIRMRNTVEHYVLGTLPSAIRVLGGVT